MSNRNNDLKKIANGECVSPKLVEHCPYCVDSCEASNNNHRISMACKEAGIKPPERKCGMCGIMEGSCRCYDEEQDEPFTYLNYSDWKEDLGLHPDDDLD